MENGSRDLMTGAAVCCCLLVGSTVLLSCRSESEEPDGSAEALAAGTEPEPLSSADPASWSCQRYGDVADESGDSYDRNAVHTADEYLEEATLAAMRERGLPLEDEEAPPRWRVLLGEICVEWPDLPLEVAVQRVADELP
jgi:hypothetical protein